MARLSNRPGKLAGRTCGLAAAAVLHALVGWILWVRSPAPSEAKLGLQAAPAARAQAGEPQAPRGLANLERSADAGRLAVGQEVATGGAAGRVIRGRVVPWSGDLPSSPLRVVAGGTSLEPGESTSTGIFRDFSERYHRLPELARAAVGEGGEFELFVPGTHDLIQLHVTGNHSMGDGIAFDVDGEGDMGDGPFEVEFTLAARATFRLVPPADTAREELERLGGVGLEFHSQGGGGTILHSVEIAAGLASEPIRIPGGSYDLEEARGAGAQTLDRRVPARLAPFLLHPRFEFHVDAGRDVTVEVPLTRGWPLEGTVLDERGAPIPGAAIRIQDDVRSMAGSFDRVFGATSGDDGRFVVPVADARSDRITVSAKGYLDLRVSAGETRAVLAAGTPHTFVLEVGRRVALTVLTPEGLPARDFPLGIASPGESIRESVRGKTDENGRVEFVGLPKAELALVGASMIAPARTSSRSPAPKPREPESVLFRSSASFGPQPIDGPTLWCVSTQLPWELLSAEPPPEALELTLFPAPHLIVRVAPGSIPEGESAFVSLWRVPAGTDQVAEGTMHQRRGFALDEGSQRVSLQVCPGRYAVQASYGTMDGGAALRPHPQPVLSDVRFVDVNRGNYEVPMTIGEGLGISGAVSVDGQHASGEVSLRLHPLGGSYGPVCETSVAGDGSFAFTGLRPGRYWITAVSPFVLRSRPRHVLVGPNSDSNELRLEAARGGFVRFQVLDPSGESTGLGQPRYVGPDGELHWAPIVQDSGVPPLVGPFAPGPLTLFHRGEVPPRTDTLIVSGETQDVLIQLPSKYIATVSGALRSPSGDVEGVTVALHDGTYRIATTLTGPGGRFTLPSPVTGSLRLHVGWHDQLPYAAADLRVRPGDQSAGTIDLPGGCIAGALCRAGTDEKLRFPLPRGLYVAARRTDQPTGSLTGSFTGSLIRSAGGGSGGFLIPFLRDGTYELACWNGDSERVPWIKPLAITIENGSTVDTAILEVPAGPR